jgi:hypothetical protein
MPLRIPHGLLDAAGGLRIGKAPQHRASFRGDKSHKGNRVPIVCNQDDLVRGIIGQFIGAVSSVSGDAIHNGVSLQVDHFHGAVAVAGPQLLAMTALVRAQFTSFIDDQHTVWAGNTRSLASDEAGNGSDEGVALGIEDFDASSAAIRNIVPAAFGIDPAYVKAGECCIGDCGYLCVGSQIICRRS